MLLVLKRTVSMRWSYCAPKTHVNTYFKKIPQSKVEFCRNILSQNTSVKKSSVFKWTPNMHCVWEQGGGGAVKTQWKF